MTSTTEIGDSFRDAVAALFEASGFKCKTEVRLLSKKVDIVATKETQIEGLQTILIETKNYKGNLDKSSCVEFKHEYGILVDHGLGDRAWLISSRDISADGRLFVDSDRKLRCFTFSELQRRLFNLETYIDTIIEDYRVERTDEFFIQPHTKSNEKLFDVVLKWLDEPEAEPLAVIGGYGIGKSTFAKYLAAYFGTLSKKDKSARVPLLIPLGEVFDDQTIDGLIGKVLASQHRVDGYYFRLFEILNQLGRFLIIFDGFDEMKHGMTISRFERNVSELMKLDKGKSKIIILGRDTAFQTDVEFRSIIQGQKQTATGLIAVSRGRRALRPIPLRGFKLKEAKHFIKHYFPVKIEDAARQKGIAVNQTWVDARIAEMLNGSLDELLVRPVHAQMICEIATQNEISIEGISKVQLYDLFIHYLIDREVNKRGRDPRFDIDTRRNFNSALAAWLWERGGASTTTFGDIPAEICEAVTSKIQHDLDTIGLRRELIAGCLADKGEQTIYFSHRSIQEFLVAEFILANGIISEIQTDPNRDHADVSTLVELLNPEIIDFLIGMLVAQKRIDAVATVWVPKLRNLRMHNVPFTSLQFSNKLVTNSSFVLDPATSPWDYWLEATRPTSGNSFQISIDQEETQRALLDKAFHTQGDVRLAAMLFWSYSIQLDRGNSVKLTAILISRMLMSQNLKSVISSSDVNYRADRTEIARLLPLQLLCENSNIATENSLGSTINLDINSLIKSIQAHLGVSFDRAIQSDDPQTIRNSAFCSHSDVTKEVGIGGTASGAINAVTKFFGSDDIRRKVSRYLAPGSSAARMMNPKSRYSGTLTAVTHGATRKKLEP